MLFVPRQVAFVSKEKRGAVMATKVSTKKNNETAASEKLAAGEGKEKGNGNKILIRSIAAFLESNGFERTLAALQSEAQLKVDVSKLPIVSLEDLFCRFSDSSNCPAGASIDFNKEQELAVLADSNKAGISLEKGKDSDDVSEDTDKKKKERSGVATDGTENEANEPSTVKKSMEDDHTAPHDETKEKKRKKKSSSSARHAESDQLVLTNGGAKKDDQELQLSKVDEDGKKKKGKKKKMNDDSSNKVKAEFVKNKIEELKSVMENPSEPTPKLKDGKRKKAKTTENAEESQTDNDAADEKSRTAKSEKTTLGDVVSHGKEKKKKKGKSTSEDLSSATLAKRDAGPSPNDAGEENTSAAEQKKDDAEKKSSKKKKKWASEENVLQDSNEAVGKDSITNSDHKNKEAVEIPKTDNSKDAIENIVVGKKRKIEEMEENNRTSEENLSAHQGDDIVVKSDGMVDQKLDNGHSVNNVEGSVLPKASKRQKKSSEPTSVIAFQRVKLDNLKFADERLQDNSYWAKDGSDIGYGAKAQQILGQVKGRGFRHEKTKKKRGAYKGGQIDLQSHSVKFNYSDDE